MTVAATGVPPLGNRQTVRVDLGPRSYDILIGEGLIAEAGTTIAAIVPGARAIIVSDRNVAAHAERVIKISDPAVPDV